MRNLSAMKRFWVLVRNPDTYAVYCGKFSSLNELALRGEVVSSEFKGSKVIATESIAAFVRGESVWASEKITAIPSPTVPKKGSRDKKKVRSVKQSKFWIIYCPEDVKDRHSYKVHILEKDVVTEARRLSEQYTGNTMVVMEAILGTMTTNIYGKEFVTITTATKGRRH
jgi:hypothetical protein